MFGFFQRSKVSADPLASVKGLLRWFDTLPKGDVYQAQSTILEKLKEFNQIEPAAQGREHLQILLKLDELAHDTQEALCSQYLLNPRMSRDMEQRLWELIVAFHDAIAISYQNALFYKWEIRKHCPAPLLTGRALRNAAVSIKWRQFRHERIDESHWKGLHWLYLQAEKAHYHEQPILLYEHDSEPLSCRNIYLQCMLLSLFGNGSLRPRQFEAIDVILRRWAPLAFIDSKAIDASDVFYVDLSQGNALRRLRKTPQNGEVRFIGAAKLRAQLDAISARLDRGETLEYELSEALSLHLPEGRAALANLKDELAPPNERNRRKSVRTPDHGRWDIIHGLENIFIVFQAASPDCRSSTQSPLSAEEVLEIKLYGFVTEQTRSRHLPASMDNIPANQQTICHLLDRSAEGFGFLLSGPAPSWINAGSLIAMRPNGADGPWKIGQIKRVLLRRNDAREVGVALFPQNALCMDLAEEIMVEDPELLRSGYEVYDSSEPLKRVGHALLLTWADGHKSILLQAARYLHGRQFLARYPDMSAQLIRMGHVLDKGEGWLEANFEVLVEG